MRAFTIGADPELFVGQEGHAKSIIGKIGGTKEHPLPLPLGPGYGVQEDNVAMEFNIPPANSREVFVSSIATAIAFLSEMVKGMHGFDILTQSALIFPKEELNTPQAMMFGCDPDYNAWTMKRNPRPKATDRALRSCGGHIHIGIQATQEEKVQLIKYMDLSTIASVLLDEGLLRKQLYGAAGACRFKPYGVEYRSLSNFWIFNEQLTGWAYDATAKAIDLLDSGLPIDNEMETITNCINSNDKKVAEELIQKYALPTL